MPDPDATTALAVAIDRYGAIETAYRDDAWSQVISLGRQLLEELDAVEEAMAAALRSRVQLLMAHSYLHGVGDRDAAEDLYRLVLNEAGVEPALRASAEAGLQECNRPLVPPAPQADQPEHDLTPTPATVASAALEPPQAEAAERPLPEPVAPDITQAMPAGQPAWLPQAGAPAGVTSRTAGAAAAPWVQATPADTTATTALVAELVEEPEMLEVRRADPTQAEEIELRPRQGSSSAAQAAQILAASAAAEAMAEVLSGRQSPAPGGDVAETLAARPDLTAVAEPAAREADPADQGEISSDGFSDDALDDPELRQGLLLVTLG